MCWWRLGGILSRKDTRGMYILTLCKKFFSDQDRWTALTFAKYSDIFLNKISSSRQLIISSSKSLIHITFCQSATTFVEQWCIDGQIFYINKLTGNKFKKGRLSKPTKKVNKNKKNEKSPTSTSALPTTTTTSTTTSSTTTTTTTVSTTTTTTISTTTRNLRRSTTTSLPLIISAPPENLDDYETDDNEVIANNIVDDGISAEYVNTVLESSIPNVKASIKMS